MSRKCMLVAGLLLALFPLGARADTIVFNADSPTVAKGTVIAAGTFVLDSGNVFRKVEILVSPRRGGQGGQEMAAVNFQTNCPPVGVWSGVVSDLPSGVYEVFARISTTTDGTPIYTFTPSVTVTVP